MPMEPMAEKWRAFGWETVEVDGHDVEALASALEPCRGLGGGSQPRMVIADTVKGKGVSFMEDARGWHADSITDEQHARAVAELRAPPP
jgi:transketolase